MNRKTLVAPSILSADFLCLGQEIQSVQQAGADWIHVDVMDGHFVPNITIGPDIVSALKRTTDLPLDVHLMISNPSAYLPVFKQAGADWLTVHYEVCRKNVNQILKQMKQLKVRSGISIKPRTKISPAVLKVLQQFELVLIMTVEPGFGGQSFMHDVIPKISYLRKYFRGHISVDGGINENTAPIVRKAGADVLVSGSYLFKQNDRKSAIQSLLKEE